MRRRSFLAGLVGDGYSGSSLRCCSWVVLSVRVRGSGLLSISGSGLIATSG